MANTVLISSIGAPGSGKSTFLERFAREQHWFYWRGDEARQRMFTHPAHTPAENQALSGAAGYAFGQLLPLGVSCVYDINFNKRAHRHKYAAIAAGHGAEFWLLWFQVPLEVAKERVRQRTAAATGELRAYYDTFPLDLVEQLHAALEPPLAQDQHVIIIDGQAAYERQRQQVLEQL